MIVVSHFIASVVYKLASKSIKMLSNMQHLKYKMTMGKKIVNTCQCTVLSLVHGKMYRIAVRPMAYDLHPVFKLIIFRY